MSEIIENQENQLNIELSDEIAEGIYSNLAIITHSNSDVISLSLLKFCWNDIFCVCYEWQVSEEKSLLGHLMNEAEGK